MEDNDYCQRCGNCCRGMQWKKRFGFDEAFDIVKGKTKKEDIENSLMDYFRLFLSNTGMKIKQRHPVEWDHERETITLRAVTGRCRNLDFDGDDKALCKNYEHRPKTCRDYLCDKAKNIMEKEQEVSNYASEESQDIYGESETGRY